MNENAELTTDIKPMEWPKTGDKLFVEGYGQQTAFLSHRASFSKYAIGYKDAADGLIEQILQRDFGGDLQFYPIAFLYRHYIELRLKELLDTGGHVVHNESRLQHGHD